MESKETPAKKPRPRPNLRKSPAKLKREDATDKDDIEAPPIPAKDPELLKECEIHINNSKNENKDDGKTPKKDKPVPKKRTKLHPKVITPAPEGHAQLVEPQSPGIDNPFYDGIIQLNKPGPPLPARGQSSREIQEKHRSSVSAKPLPVPPSRDAPGGVRKKDKQNDSKKHTEKVGHSIYELARDVDGDLDNTIRIEEGHSDSENENPESETNKENKPSNMDEPNTQINGHTVGSMIVDKYFFNFICTFKGKDLEGIREKCQMPSKDIDGSDSRDIEVRFVAKNPEDSQECEQRFGEIYEKIKKELVVEKVNLLQVREISDMQNELENTFRSLCSWKEDEHQMDVVCEKKELPEIRRCITKYGGLQMAPVRLTLDSTPKHDNNPDSGDHVQTADQEDKENVGMATAAAENPISKAINFPVGFDLGGAFQVFIYVADITGLKCDSIVNAANARLKHTGGVAKAIADAAGPELEKESKDIVKEQKKIPVTQVVRTKPGNLPCKMVLHAVGPVWPTGDREKQKECINDLRTTFVNVIDRAYKENIKSVAIPPISSGIYHVPHKEVAEAIYLALLRSADPAVDRPKSKLREIHIVDIHDSVLKLLVPKFGDDGKLVKADSGKTIAVTPIPQEDIKVVPTAVPRVRGEKEMMAEQPSSKKVKRKKSFFGGLCGGKSARKSKYN